jgi:hypothetical protein
VRVLHGEKLCACPTRRKVVCVSYTEKSCVRVLHGEKSHTKEYRHVYTYARVYTFTRVDVLHGENRRHKIGLRVSGHFEREF